MELRFPAAVTSHEIAALDPFVPSILSYLRSSGAPPDAADRAAAAAVATLRAHRGDTGNGFVGALNEQVARAVWNLPPPDPTAPRHDPDPDPGPEVEARPVGEIAAEAAATNLDPAVAAAAAVERLPSAARDAYLVDHLAALIADIRAAAPTPSPPRPQPPTPDRTGPSRTPRPRVRETLYFDMFPLPDGTFVEWGKATAAQHRARAQWLRQRSADDLAAAADHEAAADAIDAADAVCLNDLLADQPTR